MCEKRLDDTFQFHPLSCRFPSVSVSVRLDSIHPLLYNPSPFPTPKLSPQYLSSALSVPPQLSLLTETGEMQPFPRRYTPMNFEDAQAVLEDYTNAILYERGALNPNAHQAQPDDKAATYTLTNVVPQTWEFSAQAWKPQEQVIRKRLNNYCHGTAYVVTGVITSGRMIRRQNINRVAVPAYMWSAYCCVDYDRNAPFNERYRFPVFGHYGINDREGGEVVELSVQKLEEFIKKTTFVEKNFQIFTDGCVAPAIQLAEN